MYIFKTLKRYDKIRADVIDDRIDLEKRKEQSPESESVSALVQTLSIFCLDDTNGS